MLHGIIMTRHHHDAASSRASGGKRKPLLSGRDACAVPFVARRPATVEVAGGNNLAPASLTGTGSVVVSCAVGEVRVPAVIERLR